MTQSAVKPAPLVPEPEETRRGFLTYAEVRRTLDVDPRWEATPCADLQVHSEVQSIVDVQPDITGLIPLEASALYGELVVPYREIVQKKHARGRSLRDALRSGARIRGGHTGPRDNGPGGIGNGT